MAAVDSRLPRARTEGLLVRDLPDGEVMVYDLQRHQAHTLNRTAALVWRHCNGQQEADSLTAHLQQELGLPAEPEVVSLALDRLHKAHLLEGPRPTSSARVSRRAVIRRLSVAGGLTAALLPLVASVAAPTPTAATSSTVSCLPENSPCTPGANQCCSGLFCVGIDTKKCTHLD